MYAKPLKAAGAAAVAVAMLLGLAISAVPASAAKPKPVSVFPAPKTPVASDETTFSFRGLKPKNLGKVRVVGAKTGRVGHHPSAALRRTRSQRRAEEVLSARREGQGLHQASASS